MSKTKHKYKYEYDGWIDEYETEDNKKKDKKKQRRMNRALKTRNIDEILKIYNDGYDGNN